MALCFMNLTAASTVAFLTNDDMDRRSSLATRTINAFSNGFHHKSIGLNPRAFLFAVPVSLAFVVMREA